MDDRAKPDPRTDTKWSDLWQQETAAIRRTRRTTYVVAALVTALALMIVLLPALVG